MDNVKLTLKVLREIKTREPIDLLGFLHEKEYIVEYIASYYEVFLKKVSQIGLLGFFEQDGHSFQPYKANNCWPINLDDDTEAYELFIDCLKYVDIMSSNFSYNKDIYPVLHFFNTVVFQLGIQEEDSHCESCKFKYKKGIQHCKNCHTELTQYDNLIYVPDHINEHLRKMDIEFYSNMEDFNYFIVNFLYNNIKNNTQNKIYSDFVQLQNHHNLKKIKNF